MINVTCDKCGHYWRVPQKFAGQKIHCNECKHVISLPEDNKWERFAEDGLPFGFFCGGALIIVALWSSWNYVGDFLQNKKMSKWHKVDCYIINSKITDDYEVPFRVKYSYEWEGDYFENECYQSEFQDISKLTNLEAEELAEEFKEGDRSVCYVNSEKPEEAVLCRGKPYLSGYMVIPAFLIVVGIRQFYIALKDFLTSGRERIFSGKVWKYITVFAVAVAFIMNFLVTFAVTVGLSIISFYLGEGLEYMRRKFVKMQLDRDAAENENYVVCKKIYFTVPEKAVVAISVTVYVAIMFILGRQFLGHGHFAPIGIIFCGLWIGLSMTIIVWMILSMMHAYHYSITEGAKKQDGRVKYDLHLWTLLVSNLIVIVWAIVGKWSLCILLLIYWGQSLCIGVFLLIRSFVSKEAVKGADVTVRKRTKVIKIYDFFIVYSAFHLFYVLLLLVLFKDIEIIDLSNTIVVSAVGIFFLQQVIDLVYDLIKGIEIREPEKLIKQTAFRIVPIHFVIIGVGVLKMTAILSLEHPVMLSLFIGLKTFADVVAYLYTRESFYERIKRVF